jgi:hypothetical protein
MAGWPSTICNSRYRYERTRWKSCMCTALAAAGADTSRMKNIPSGRQPG